jgi:hypothetical protein
MKLKIDATSSASKVNQAFQKMKQQFLDHKLSLSAISRQQKSQMHSVLRRLQS